MVLPNSPFKIWGPWVMGYLSYDRTNKQRDTQRNKQRLLLYISKYMYIIGTQSESSIYKFGLSVCLSVCLFVSNKRQNGWTDRAQIFCGTSCDPREGLWMIKFSKIWIYQNLIFENFENPRIFFWKSAKFFCLLFVYKEKPCVF